MDRTMYGKFDPGARQPYRIILCKDALLADLQNSVPGGSGSHQFSFTPPNTIIQKQCQAAANINQHSYTDSSGYGSLRGTAALTQPAIEEHFVEEIRTMVSPSVRDTKGNVNYPQPSSPFYNQGVLLKQGHCTTSQPQSTNTANNLSELDSLLQDLSSTRYNGGTNSFSKKEMSGFHNNQQTSSKYNTYSSYSSVEERPTVDSLLNEMDNASLYAIPNGVRGRSPTPGRHVTITVRETKTENVLPSENVAVQITKKSDILTANNASYASSATKELDDLMASLSDFKVNNEVNHYHQTITDYAKPNKGTSHLTETITETITSNSSAALVDDNQTDQLDSMLGSLQANMNRQGVNTVQKGCCNACEKPIVGQVITALGKTWHPEHFTCNHCNQELGTRNFFERDGFPYCEPDYHNLFSPRCAYCNGAILDKCVTALDKTWHTEHFFCAQCGQQFGEDGFHERDGKPYCRNDYFEMFAPKCHGCNRAIMENYISALNSQWHPDCFVCRDCKQPVRGKSFYAMEGKPVCPSCVGVDEEE